MQQRELAAKSGDAALLERSLSGWGAGGRWTDAVSDVLLGERGAWEPGGADTWAAALSGTTPRGSPLAPPKFLPGALQPAVTATPSPLAGLRHLLLDSTDGAAGTASSSQADAVQEIVAQARDDTCGGSLSSGVAATLLARAAQRADGANSSSSSSTSSSEEDEDEESEEADELDDVADAPSEAQPSGRALRQALLTGHLLALLTSPHGPLPHALPALTRELQATGMLPRWLRELLLRRPALFDRAFRSTFDAVSRARAATGAGDPTGRWAVARFWSHTGSDVAALGGRAPPEVASRYRTDFEELSQLGRGSFGQVVLAVNRLDGRRYAIKKINLTSDVSLNAKILREVATLSRLEHASVVRYYQAFTETGTDVHFARGDASGDFDDDNGDGSSDWRGSSVGLRSSAATSSAPPGERRVLYLQMEYCRTTLREVLDNASTVIDSEQAWVWLRQARARRVAAAGPVASAAHRIARHLTLPPSLLPPDLRRAQPHSRTRNHAPRPQARQHIRRHHGPRKDWGLWPGAL